MDIFNFNNITKDNKIYLTDFQKKASCNDCHENLLPYGNNYGNKKYNKISLFKELLSI